MKKTLPLLLVLIIFTINACTSPVTATPAPLPATVPAASGGTQIPIHGSPTEVDQSATWKLYTNSAFGLGFHYPSNWFGPGEYVSDETLRVEVGSDMVYPYGEPPEQPSDGKNSYNVVIQYTKNNQNSYWKDTYQPLQNLKDGGSLSDARSLLIKVRQLNIGRFKGFEYITTLSETGQTDHFYIRSVMLYDEQTNDLLTIMGQPYNVEVSNGTDWRDAYRTIDEANLAFFHEIVESITVK
jgi:hypothetical protein